MTFTAGHCISTHLSLSEVMLSIRNVESVRFMKNLAQALIASEIIYVNCKS